MEDAEGAEGRDHLPQPSRLVWQVALCEAALLLGVELSAVRRRYFVNDDYQMLYTTWLRSIGKVPPRDFGVQSYHLLPDLLSPVLSLCGARVEAGFAIRLLFWGVLAAVAALTTRLTLRLLPPACAPFALVLALCSWPMLERGLDIRPDLISSALWLGCLLLAARTRGSRSWSIVLGALLAASAALRPKSLLLVPAVALMTACMHHAQQPRPEATALLRKYAWMALGACATSCAFAGYLSVTQQWPHFMAGQRTLARLASSSGGDPGARRRAFALLWRTDPVFCVLVPLGASTLLLWLRRAGASSRALAPHAVMLGLSVAMVALNPAFYSYNFVVLLPLLAPYAATGCASIAQLPPQRWRNAVSIALLAALPSWHAPLLHALATTATNEHQLALHGALAATPAHTVVFALEGVGLFRPSTYDWRLSAVSVPLYEQGAIDLRRQLESARPEIMILSYRLPGWLTPDDRAWLEDSYQELSPNLAVLRGAAANGRGRHWRLARTGRYRVVSGPCEIDGTLHLERETLTLGAGQHLLRSPTPGRAGGVGCVVRFDWPEGASLRHPSLPYLIFPDLPIYPVRP